MSNLVALGSVAEINPRLPRGIDESQQVSFLTMASVSEDGLILEEETRILGETKKGYTYFERGDVLIAKITPCFENGKAALVDQLKHQVGFGSTEFHVIRVHSDKLDARYLFYLVWSDLFRFYGGKSMTGAAGQKRVSSDFLKAFEIPLPPLPEQRRIAAILDKADAIRRKRQEAIRLTEDFLRSVFLDMFGDPVTNPKGWPLRPIGSVLRSIDSGWSANGEDRARQPEEWAVLKISSVTTGRFIPDECKVVPRESITRELITPKRGDLLFSRANTRELVAATCLVQRDEPNIFLPDKLWRIVPDEKLTCSEYLKYLLSHPMFRENFTKQATGTSGSMLNVSMAKLRGLEMPLPPIELQKKFAELVWKSLDVQGRVNNSEGEMSMFFNTLVQRAFRGDL